MGEILRAVMTEKALWRRPAFYSITIPVPPTLVLGQTLTGFFQMKSDRWALVTSLYVSLADQDRVLVGAPSVAFDTGNLFDVATQRTYFKIDGQTGNFGGPANAQFTLPEYILLEPDQMLGFRCNLLLAAPADGQDVLRLQMQAIEYAMPAGVGKG